MDADIRWKQRLQNFDRAFRLLAEVLQADITQFSSLEMEGIAQRFAYTFELAWKVLKDLLEHNGIVLDTISPRHVIKQAFATKLITDGDIWIEMMEARNKLSHVYDEAELHTLLQNFSHRYFPAIAQLHSKLLQLRAS